MERHHIIKSRAWQALFVVLCSSLLLQSCSTKLVYNYLDWIVPWTLDDYVDLDEQQEAQVDRSLAQALSWHRQQQLPLYVADLQTLRQQLRGEVSVTEVTDVIFRARAHWQHLIETLFPALLELGRSFTDQQVEQLLQTLREELDEVQAEHDEMSVEARQDEWAEAMADGLSDWLGALTDAQQARIRVWSTQRTSSFQLWIAFRYRWLDELQLTLASRHDPQAFRQHAERILLRVDEIRAGEYLAHIEQNRLVYAQMMVDISASMTKRQHQHLDDKLAELIADLNALHREG